MPGRYNFGISTNIGNVADPSVAQDAATKAYVDANAGGPRIPIISFTTLSGANNVYTSATLSNYANATFVEVSLDGIVQQNTASTTYYTLSGNNLTYVPFTNAGRSLQISPSTSGTSGGGGGTVTSIGLIAPSPLLVTSQAITTQGNLTLVWGSGQIPVANLGTGTASNNTYLRGDGSWQATVTSFKASGSPDLTGDISLLAGNNISLTQSGNSITIAGTGGGGTGTVTSVTSTLNALTFTNSTINPSLTTQNVTSASTQFLRADGTWAIPAGGSSPATVIPLPDGVGTVGTSLDYARADHIHPFSLTTTGTSGAATYTSSTGVLNVPSIPTLPTFPSGAIVGTTDTQTLTNKTYTGGAVSRILEPVSNVTPVSSVLTVDVSLSSIFRVTALLGATTLTINNVGAQFLSDLQTFTLTVLSDQAATTNYINNITITGATTTTVRWIGGTTPTTGSLTPATDLYSITIIRITVGVYRVLASRIGY